MGSQEGVLKSWHVRKSPAYVPSGWHGESRRHSIAALKGARQKYGYGKKWTAFERDLYDDLRSKGWTHREASAVINKHTRKFAEHFGGFRANKKG